MFQYDFNNIPINSVMFQSINLSFREGGKRVILNPKVNIWKNFSETKPYVNVDEAFNVWYGIKPSHRPKGSRILNEVETAEVRATPKNVTHKTLSEKYGVSVSTIKRARSGQKGTLIIRGNKKN